MPLPTGRWLAIVLTAVAHKYSMTSLVPAISYLTTLDKFQLYTFLMGVRTAPPDPVSDAWDYLAEYMDEDNDWHDRYDVGHAVSNVSFQ